MKDFRLKNIAPTAFRFLMQSYDYLWLKTMVDKAKTAPPGSTLITGSSHALNAVYEGAWSHAVNCSMHSQDLYYDFRCAREAIQGGGRFERCLIVMGYYIAFQDLSRSKVSREDMISRVYYPVFHDAHNWDAPVATDPWGGFDGVPEPMKAAYEAQAAAELLRWGTYYNPQWERTSYFGRLWGECDGEERQLMGAARAADHNKLFCHTQSLVENQTILNEFVRFLHEHGVTPIMVITPFTPEYTACVLPEMRDAVLAMVDAVPDAVHFVDFNEAEGLFDAADFMDTDHLSLRGAQKVSGMLTELFGR